MTTQTQAIDLGPFDEVVGASLGPKRYSGKLYRFLGQDGISWRFLIRIDANFRDIFPWRFLNFFNDGTGAFFDSGTSVIYIKFVGDGYLESYVVNFYREPSRQDNVNGGNVTLSIYTSSFVTDGGIPSYPAILRTPGSPLYEKISYDSKFPTGPCSGCFTYYRISTSWDEISIENWVSKGIQPISVIEVLTPVYGFFYNCLQGTFLIKKFIVNGVNITVSSAVSTINIPVYDNSMPMQSIASSLTAAWFGPVVTGGPVVLLRSGDTWSLPTQSSSSLIPVCDVFLSFRRKS
ncbi:MAG: hypothetical protein HQL66_00770 [Magnetococcales bacterium]|nr:hypothetical protein [Magnetococcales bacterium]